MHKANFTFEEEKKKRKNKLKNLALKESKTSKTNLKFL